MKINLRFGLQRDKEIIRNLRNKLDGLVIPAHILAYQSGVTATFVSSFSNMPFIIDPMTYLFQHQKDNLTNDTGDTRASISKMCDEYRLNITNMLSGRNRLIPENFADMRTLCENVYRSQLSIPEKASTKKAAKYIERFGSGNSVVPKFILPPYFRFESTSAPWYSLSLAMGQTMQDICSQKNEGLESGVIIFLSTTNLNDNEIEQIATDYKDFKHIVIWFDNFDEVSASQSEIVKARKMVSALSDFSEVEILYAGFLLMTTAAEGAKAVSHGLTYSQHKSFEATPGGGGLPERFYIPQFRAFRSLSQTDSIFHMRPELMCGCSVCRELLQNNPDRIVLFGDEPEKLREHFINVRRQEADNMENINRQELVADLRRVYSTYHNLISNLPNPDAFFSDSNMKGLEYLNCWADGISQEI